MLWRVDSCARRVFSCQQQRQFGCFFFPFNWQTVQCWNFDKNHWCHKKSTDSVRKRECRIPRSILLSLVIGTCRPLTLTAGNLMWTLNKCQAQPWTRVLGKLKWCVSSNKREAMLESRSTMTLERGLVPWRSARLGFGRRMLFTGFLNPWGHLC